MRQPLFAAAAVAAGLIAVIQQAAPLPAAAVFDVQSLRTIDDASQANHFFISQYRSQFNPQASDSNANCGPASLAMAMKRFFPRVSSIAGSSPEKLVHIARLAMTGQDDADGNTDNFDVVKGAERLGMKAQIASDFEAVNAVLDSGGLAVVSGSPSVPGSFAHRLRYRHCHGGHFIVIAGRRGDRYLMNDPECPDGSMEITGAELRAFMSYWPPDDGSLHGAVALWPGRQPNDVEIADLARAIVM